METRVFRSKVDTWLLGILLACVLACLGALWAVLQTSASHRWVSATGAFIFGIALPVWTLCSTRYFLSRQALRIVSGPFRWRIPLGDITAVEPTRSLLSSPALSLDRLRIEYGAGRAVLISPLNQEDFLRDLKTFRRPASLSFDMRLSSPRSWE